jgi:hypothetical protein
MSNATKSFNVRVSMTAHKARFEVVPCGYRAIVDTELEALQIAYAHKDHAGKEVRIEVAADGRYTVSMLDVI